MVKNPKTGNSTVIKVSAQDHSVTVGNSFTIVKDKPVTVNVFNSVSIKVDAKQHVNELNDASTWLYINMKDFGIKVRFYKKHLDMFLTKTNILTEKAGGIIGNYKFCIMMYIAITINLVTTGQFLRAHVVVNVNDQFIKLNDGDPVPIKKKKIWPSMKIPGYCWYGASTDNQGAGMIKGVYTDYIVKDLLTGYS